MAAAAVARAVIPASIHIIRCSLFDLIGSICIRGFSLLARGPCTTYELVAILLFFHSISRFRIHPPLSFFGKPRRSKASIAKSIDPREHQPIRDRARRLQAAIRWHLSYFLFRWKFLSGLIPPLLGIVGI